MITIFQPSYFIQKVFRRMNTLINTVRLYLFRRNTIQIQIPEDLCRPCFSFHNINDIHCIINCGEKSATHWPPMTSLQCLKIDSFSQCQIKERFLDKTFTIKGLLARQR